MKTLKLGSEGPDVVKLQEILGLKTDGYFGIVTHEAVIKFQKMHSLTPDGIVGPMTWAALTLNVDSSVNEEHADFREYMLTPGIFVTNDKGEKVWKPNYYKGIFNKEWLVFHHTAGGPSPYRTVDFWEKDGNAIGTEFVVGGISPHGDETNDGVTLRCLPAGGFAAHLTIGNTRLHRESIGVELCNYGGLTKGGYYKNKVWVSGKANTYYNAYGGEMPEDCVYDLGWTYRFNRYFHKYSLKQIEECERIAKYAQSKYNMNLKGGLQDLIHKYNVEKAFEYIPEYMNSNPGIYTHGNVFAGKNDVFPQKEFIDMIMSL